MNESRLFERLPQLVREGSTVVGPIVALISTCALLAASCQPARESALTVQWESRAYESQGAHALGSVDALIPQSLERAVIPEHLRLARGQTLVGWLTRDLGMDAAQAYSVARSLSEHVEPRLLRAGSELAVYRNADHAPERLVLPLAGRGEVDLRYDGQWRSEFREYLKTERRDRVVGTVEGGFEAAVVEAGGPVMLAYEIAQVLQWDLDFNRDLRLGDEFNVVYDAVLSNGRVREISSIDAVRFVNRGQVIEAYRFADLGYYDRHGKPLRKQFLRSPLPYSRVTSRFSNRRFHPILKVYRPHLGVDYGAPRGTPVRVTANGTVVSAARTRGGGKTVTVRHANGYRTAYLHLSGYADGLRAGRRVQQGEVIGFVGSTGLSTAPHLDYRVQKDGRWIDPLSLPNEPAEPLSDEQLRQFLLERERLEADLLPDSSSGTFVAAAS